MNVDGVQTRRQMFDNSILNRKEDDNSDYIAEQTRDFGEQCFSPSGTDQGLREGSSRQISMGILHQLSIMQGNDKANLSDERRMGPDSENIPNEQSLSYTDSLQISKSATGGAGGSFQGIAPFSPGLGGLGIGLTESQSHFIMSSKSESIANLDNSPLAVQPRKKVNYLLSGLKTKQAPTQSHQNTMMLLQLAGKDLTGRNLAVKEASVIELGLEEKDIQGVSSLKHLDENQIKPKNQLIIFSILLQFVKAMLVKFMYKDSSMMSALQYKIIGDSSIVIEKQDKEKIQQMQVMKYRNIFERIKYAREINYKFSPAYNKVLQEERKHRQIILTLILDCHNFLKMKVTKMPIFKPNSSLMLIWDSFFLVFVLFLLVAVPLELSFELPESHKAILVFLFDIYLGFHTGFYEFGEIIMNRKLIQREFFIKKFRTNFYSTVLAIINIIFDMRIINFCALIMKIGSLVEKISKIDLNLQLYQKFPALFELSKLILLIMMSIHLFGCGFFFMGSITVQTGQKDDWIRVAGLKDSDFFEKYVNSIYFSMVSMITIGYGDIHPVNVYEKLYVLGMSFISCGLFAFSVNLIGGIITDNQKKTKEFRYKQYVVGCYMNDKQVKQSTQMRVLKYIEFINEFQDSSIEEGSRILGSCPQEIKEELLREYFGRIIKRNRIFKSLFSSELLSSMSLVMKEKRFAPGEILISKGQMLRQLYFITNGQTEYFFSNNEQSHTLCDLNEGVIDLRLFLTQQPSDISVRSKGITTAAFIDMSTWQELLQQFQQDKEKECYLRDQFIYDKRFLYPCKSCGQYRHDIFRCPQVNYKINETLFFKKLFRDQMQVRKEMRKSQCRRGKEANCLHNNKAIKMNLKIFRWKCVKEMYENYEMTDMQQELLKIEKDKEFYYRCPKIKQNYYMNPSKNGEGTKQPNFNEEENKNETFSDISNFIVNRELASSSSSISSDESFAFNNAPSQSFYNENMRYKEISSFITMSPTNQDNLELGDSPQRKNSNFQKQISDPSTLGKIIKSAQKPQRGSVDFHFSSGCMFSPNLSQHSNRDHNEDRLQIKEVLTQYAYNKSNANSNVGGTNAVDSRLQLPRLSVTSIPNSNPKVQFSLQMDRGKGATDDLGGLTEHQISMQMHSIQEHSVSPQGLIEMIVEMINNYREKQAHNLQSQFSQQSSSQYPQMPPLSQFVQLPLNSQSQQQQYQKKKQLSFKQFSYPDPSIVSQEKQSQPENLKGGGSDHVHPLDRQINKLRNFKDSSTTINSLNEKACSHLFGKFEFSFDLSKEYLFYYPKFNYSNVVKAYKKYQQLVVFINTAFEPRNFKTTLNIQSQRRAMRKLNTIMIKPHTPSKNA